MENLEVMTVFDRRLVRRRRDRAAGRFAAFSFLVEEVAERLADRLSAVRRAFPRVLDLGCHDGTLGRVLAGRQGIERVVSCDLSPAMARAAGGLAVAADEEWLPFADGTFDLVVSGLSLHWVNDLPGALIQARRVLKPDGFFLAAMLGGDTLIELRRCLMEAELEIAGGVSPRVSPFAGVRDGGGLLQRAGLALPVADTEVLTVTYADAFALMRDLRGMGETNAVLARRRGGAGRALFLEAAQRYAQAYAEPDGRIPASFEILYLAGWVPDDSQQKPMRPGSATVRLADVLEGPDRPAGACAGRQGDG
ncbi:MAG: methyltransferase domain-containing protein [Azospirillum sp.]|nr:methyltransferase domain-containing protein [Azospirillum sp.]